MQYVALTPDAQAETLRAVLLQAEHDHLVHSLEVASVEAALGALPEAKGESDDHADARASAAARLSEREANRDRAEGLAEFAKSKLDELGLPYVAPAATAEPSE
jgi:hypothetical protein